MKFVRSDYRLVLRLARQLLAERPDIKTAELARQLGVSIKAAYNYRAAVAAGTPDPPDPVKLAREYLLAHPEATGAQVGKHLGLGRDMGEHYSKLARLDIQRRPPPSPLTPKHTYPVPRFIPKKGK